MEKLHCAGSPCQAYCHALGAQGVEVSFEAGCSVPDMFTVSTEASTTVQFTPEIVGESLDNPALVHDLGEALAKTLVEHPRAWAEISHTSELAKTYDAEHGARRNLWQAMIKASHQGRTFTDVELSFYQQKVHEAVRQADVAAKETLPHLQQAAQAAFDYRRLTKDGLLFDDQMLGIVDRLAGNAMLGKPTLLVGDKGIAKTQAARFVARMSEQVRRPDGTALEPIIISGHGDMMSTELMGQISQDKTTGLFVFKEGKLIDAMREGRPVILDEVNIGDQAVLMRLQDILLRRPGQKVTIQENGSDSITIQPGFVVFATANEASTRYQHRAVLDPAFRDRYDVVRVEYPDADNEAPLAGIPRSMLRLAVAAAVDERGQVSPHLDLAEVERLARLAHVTQHLYTTPAVNSRAFTMPGDAATNALSSEPIMTDCITPRVVYDTVSKCRAGNLPGITLTGEIEHLIARLDQAGSAHNKNYAQQALGILTTN